MKKLMIAAAAAAMIGGAYAGACDDIDVEDVDLGCLVYDLNFSLKTLTPAKLVCKACDKCTDDDIVYYLKDGTVKLQGYIWLCAELCWDTDTDLNVVLWNKSAQKAIIPLWYAIEGGKIVQYPETFNFEFLARYGKNAKSVAAYYSFGNSNFELSAAGTKGSITVTKDEEVYIKNITGNVVGAWTVENIVIPPKGCEDDPEYYNPMITGICDCWTDWCDGDGEEVDMVPFSGTWSMKYNKSLSTGTKSMLQVVPSYARELED